MKVKIMKCCRMNARTGKELTVRLRIADFQGGI